MPRPRESSLVTWHYNAKSPTTNAAKSSASVGSPSLPQYKQLSHLIYIQWLTGKSNVLIMAPPTLWRKRYQKVIPSTLCETQGTLVIKRSSHRSLKSNPSIPNRDSGISLKAGEKEEYAEVITTPEKQVIDKVSY